MKKLIYSIVLLVSMSSMSFAQEANVIAKSNGKSELAASMKSGEYEFQFKTERSKESVEKAASYYTSIFNMSYDESSKTVEVKLIENTPSARMVVARFLSANQIRYVEIDGNNVVISDFIEQYLK